MDSKKNMSTKQKASKKGWPLISASKKVRLSDATSVRLYNPHIGTSRRILTVR